MSIYSFWRWASELPDQVAVVDPNGREVRAAELLSSCNRLVHGLRALGLGPGDTVAVMFGNELAMLEIYLAAAQSGLYVTPLNVHLADEELAHIIHDCGARALFCSGSTEEVGLSVARRLSFSRDLIFGTACARSTRAYEELKNGQPDTTPNDRKSGGLMTYTSGTTGTPKGVRRYIRNVGPDLSATGNALFLTRFGMSPYAGVHLAASPLYHTAPLNFCINHLHFGHTIVLMDAWSPEGMLERIRRHRVTSSHMVPAHFRALLSLPENVRAAADVSSLTHVIHSAAPCPVRLKRQMLEWWGPIIYEYYAASEGGGTIATPTDWLAKPGTVGRPWALSAIRIARDDGTEASPFEVGTIYMRMGKHTFEYQNDPARTASTWRDGFFTAGDVGYVDEEGFLFLSDRTSDVILTGGKKVYSAGVEAVLAQHPGVADVAVFGLADDACGERVVSVVQLSEGLRGTGELTAELFELCRQRLESYQCPQRITFTASLPRDANGKMAKRVLRELYGKRLG